MCKIHKNGKNIIHTEHPTVIELLITQILGLCYFLKLSNKCHEIWPSGHDYGVSRKWSCFHRFAKVQSTLGVKKRWYFNRLPMKQFGSFSVKSIIPGFCVLILLAKRHKPPKQVNLTQNSVIQLKLSKARDLATEKVSWKSVLSRQWTICEDCLDKTEFSYSYL